MTRDVISVAPAETVAAAKKHFRRHGIHHLLVVDGRAVVGIVTHQELIRHADGDLIRDVMTREVTPVGSDTPIRRAAALMIGGRTGCLPVIDDGALAGIITTSDLRRAVSADDTMR